MTNTAFIDLSNFSAFIAPAERKVSRNGNDKKKPFIVVNTDYNYGLFVKTLVSRAKELGLAAQSGLFQQKAISSIKTNELIVFGDASLFCNFDYRVETDIQSIASLDSRKWKVYDLTTEFDKVLRRLEDYAKANKKVCNNTPTIEIEISVERAVRAPKTSPCPKAACPFLQGLCIPRATTGIKKSDYNRFQDFVSFTTPKPAQIKDVAVHHNWVKIGYDQYDIILDAYGREHIVHESGTFFIKEDRFGRRYLVN